MTTGKDLIRRALSARKKINICAHSQRYWGRVPGARGFCIGSAALPPETLKALALHLFIGNTAYDPVDLLRPASRNEPVPMGIRPPSVTEMGLTLPKFTGGSPPLYPPLPHKPKAQRPGWVEEA